jgi:transcriptional regulator GlxA family with amidase domain
VPIPAGQQAGDQLDREDYGKREYGRGQLRIHHALILLASGRAVTDTAMACGWANPTSFIDAFTAALGQTPGRYRSQLGAAG